MKGRFDHEISMTISNPENIYPVIVPVLETFEVYTKECESCEEVKYGKILRKFSTVQFPNKEKTLEDVRKF